MTGLLPLIVAGAGWGFLAGISIGPFLGYVINIVLTRGWRRTLPLVSIPLLVDTPIIITFLYILRELPDFVVDTMGIVGGAFVLWLGWNTWQDNQRMQAYKKKSTQINMQVDPNNPSPAMTGVFLRGMLVNALNPAPYLFWSTVSGPTLIRAIEQGGAGYAAAFLISYYGIFLSLILALMIVVDRLGDLDERFNRYLLPVTIILMIVLGIGLIGVGLFDLIQAEI